MADDLQSVYEQAEHTPERVPGLDCRHNEQTVRRLSGTARSGCRVHGITDQWASRKEELVSPVTTHSVSRPFRLTGQMEAWTVSNESVLPTGRKTRALLAAIALSAPRPADVQDSRSYLEPAAR